MNGWRTDRLPGAVAGGPHRAAGRRIVGHYLTDLAVSLVIVLLVGWVFHSSSIDFYIHQASITQSTLYVALGHFTPLNVIANCAATMEDLRRSLNTGYMGDGFAVAAGQTFATIGWVLLNIFLAAPKTLLDLYRQTNGIASWIVLAGFTAAISSVFAWLLPAASRYGDCCSRQQPARSQCQRSSSCSRA